MTTRGGQSDGGKAQLRADGQTEVLQDGCLQVADPSCCMSEHTGSDIKGVKGNRSSTWLPEHTGKSSTGGIRP